MTITVTNFQHEARVNRRAVTRLARCAAKRLRITTPGTLSITFIGARRMRTLNKQFLRHDWETDVLSFRYDPTPTPQRRQTRRVVGDILIAPRLAHRYATRHGLSYGHELSRYVVHGLLHWLGQDDRTRAQQRVMRAREDRLLAACGTPGRRTA